MRDIYAEIMSAAHSGAFGMNELPTPTVEQCRSGNYKKGRVTVHGLPIAIETPQGQPRMGKSDGKLWSVICMAHYGDISGTKGADGDPIDVYLGPVPESTKVWVVNQNGKDGAFDEHKVLLGFHDEESARTTYMNSYERGWNGLGSLITCSIDQFRWWLKFGDTTKPLTERALPHDGTNDMTTETVWDSAANPVGCDVADLIYRMRKDDGDGLLLDAVTVNDVLEASDGELTLDALVVEYNKVERKAEQLRKIMESVGTDVKPVAVQVTPPFKQRGTTNVVILYELSDGQTVSVWMHNPDSTPNRILPQDELVSWAWRLNKKDVSIIVAPEKGQDLNPREVARRIMRLAEKNSARFAKANAGRAERMANIESLKATVSAGEATLQELDAEFADLTEKVEAKRALVPATLEGSTQGADTEIEKREQAEASLPPSTVRNQAVKAALAELGWNTAPSSIQVMVTLDGSVYSLTSSVNESRGKLVSIDWNDSGWKYTDDLSLDPAVFASELDKAFRASIAAARAAVRFDPTTPEGYAQIIDDQAALEAHQDQLDSFFQGRIIAVRNALRELGWDGGKLQPISKNGYTLKPVFKQVGAGANIVGMHFEIQGVPGYFMSDDLSRSPEELAEKIDMGVPAAPNAQKEDPARVVASADDLRAGDYVAFNWGQGQGRSYAKVTADGGKAAVYVGGEESLIGKPTVVQYKPVRPNGPVGWWHLDAGQVASLIGLGEIQSENGPQDFRAIARSLTPADFETRDDAEGFTAVAADGFGIRLRQGPRGSILGYVLDAKGQDSLGSRGSDPVQIKYLVDTALQVIAEKREAASKLPGGSQNAIIIDDFAPLAALGLVTIESVGNENLYFVKDGQHYMTKLLNTDQYMGRVGEVINLNAAGAMPFPQWEEALYTAIEEQGEMSRSDAQGVAEAQGTMMDEQYVAGATPEAAAAAVLAAGTAEADSFAGADAALTGLGFKRVQNNDWASPAYPQEGGSSKGFNVRASGDPVKYRLSYRVTFPGITGASQDVGTYDTLDELISAASGEIEKAGGSEKPQPTELDGDKAFLNEVIGGSVDYMDEALATRLEAIQAKYSDDAEVQALFEQAANAYSAYMIEQARAALA